MPEINPPSSLRCEYKTNPLGIDTLLPRLSWVLASTERDVVQSAYQIHATDETEQLLWDSGKVASSQTVHVTYGGPALTGGQVVHWKVRCWDGNGAASDWSETAYWQMGLLSAEDWKASWISLPPTRPGVDLHPCPYLRRGFEVTKPIARATAFVTARGVYTLHLNGTRVGDAHFAPGWTDYNKRVQYQTYDVTEHLTSGPNAIGAVLGDGWYAGYIGWGRKRNHYGEHPHLLAQLQIEFVDGSSETVSTDGSWRGATGPILFSDFLSGESYDARLEIPDWDCADFDDSAWKPVEVGPEHEAGIARVAQVDPPIRVTQELRPIAVTSPTPGTHIFDLGQNMVGWARLTVRGPAGTMVQMRYGEMLSPDGTLYVENLRAAKATDTYILKGGAAETFEPNFTFHGFRYVELVGYPGEPGLDDLIGCVLHSDTARVGTFECGEPMVNQLVRNIDWGQRGNFISIPTDCPQRDERLGWMGDAQIFARTAAGNRDVASFFTKWMVDVVDAQSAEGGFSDVSPRLVDMADGAPAWADAGVIVPWTIYQVYGDTRILETHYDAMARWIDYLDSANPDHLWLNRRNNDFGDWLSIEADTDKSVLATAYFAYDTSLMARIARILGRSGDADRYETLFAQIKDAFLRAYVSDDATITGDTQTAYILALRFGLLPTNLRPLAAQRLVRDIEAKSWHLSTGFVGVGSLCPVLTEIGRSDVAHKLLLNDTFPSWGYSIRHGATTIWERWNGWTDTSGFFEPGMNSFNHYALGSVGEWLQRSVAGIDTSSDAPGFERIVINPQPSSRLRFVRASYESIRGTIATSWTLDDGVFTLDVEIPANTSASVTLPDGQTHRIGSGAYQFTSAFAD